MTALAAGEIVVAIGSEPSTLDPQARDDGGERAVNDNIYETLMAREPDGTLVPGLAAEPPTKVDDTTWEFKLRPNITFTNGEPFNANSVVTSVTRIIDPALKSEQMAYFGTIKGAEKVDDLTVRIITTGPDPILPSRMYWMKMIPPKYAADPKFAEAPVGTGPYKLEAFNRGQDIVLVANPDYWGGKPAIDKVTYRFVGESGTRLSGLVAGEFDVITNLLPEFVESVPKSAAVQGLETSVIILSTENEVTKDPRVRQALNIAIDRQALADSLFGGYALPARGQLVNPKAFGFNEALEVYPYDPEKAKALIKEAGAEGKTINLVGEVGPLAQGPRADRGRRPVLGRDRPQGELPDRGVRPVPHPPLRQGEPARRDLRGQLRRASRRRSPDLLGLRVGQRLRLQHGHGHAGEGAGGPDRDRCRQAQGPLRRDHPEGL